MTTGAGVLLLVAAVFALADWVAVARRARPLEYVCKPATLAALLGVTLLLDPADPAQPAWFVAALGLSLLGDVFLMLPQDRPSRFVAGLGSFLLGHVAYVVGFAVAGYAIVGLVLGLAVVTVATAIAGAPLVRRMLRSPQHRSLATPVVAYIGVIGVMVASAIATANPWAIGGALLFLGSDTMIGYERFGFDHPPAWMRLAIIVTYHLGQAGLVLSLVWGR